METITLTIDGNTVSTRAGITILELARQQNIPIPTLCHHDALRPIGACRLCQVEDQSRGLVVPACVTKVQSGMVIATNSPRVVKNRRNILRLLMAAHPESCVVCEKGNRCELRNLAAQMGLGKHGLDSMSYHPGVVDMNPFMSRDLSKCIMCAKCIRADEEVVCEGVIDYDRRGFDAYPASLFNNPLEQTPCTFCGTCLSVCPTGAIFEKDKHRLNHASFRTRSVCSYCACGCSMYLEHNQSELMGTSPSAKPHTGNGISLCVKGRFGHDYVTSRERLVTPLMKTAQGFQPISWEEALGAIAGKLKEIREEFGPDSLGFIGGARSTNEENYLFQKLARTVVGTPNVDHASRAYWSGFYDAMLSATGFSSAPNPFKEVEKSDVILIIGADPTRTAPVLGYHIKRAARFNKAKILVVDPVKTKLVRFADLWLRPRIATDYHLLIGMLKAILEEGLQDHEFIATKTSGFESLQSFLEKQSVSRCSEECGVEEEAIRRAARIFAEADASFIIAGHGLVRQKRAGDTAVLLLNLILATGNLGKNRAGFIPAIHESNAQGALDMGVTPYGSWGPYSVAPPNPAAAPGLNAFEMISAAGKGRLKGLYVFNENTACLYPDASAVARILGEMPFLVVQDMFMTETARLADIVLPSTAWAEKEGTVTSVERRVQRLHKAVLPPGDFPPDWQIFSRLAAHFGDTWNYKSEADIFSEIIEAVPLYAELPFRDLDNTAIFRPQPGLEVIHDTVPHGIGHPDGKAFFLTPGEAVEVAAPPDDRYPFILMQGSLLQHSESGSRSRFSRKLQKAAPQAYVGVCAEDMEAAGLAEGESIRVISPNAEIRAQVKPDPELPPGVLFMPAAFPDANPFALFTWDWSKAGWSGDSKHCRVRIERTTSP